MTKKELINKINDISCDIFFLAKQEPLQGVDVSSLGRALRTFLESTSHMLDLFADGLDEELGEEE